MILDIIILKIKDRTMTQQDKEEIKELLNSCILIANSEHTAKFQVIDYKLDTILQQTTKTNGRVNKLEEKELTHVINCPLQAKVRLLEDNQLTSRAIKKWIVAGIGIASVIMTIIFSAFKLFTSV